MSESPLDPTAQQTAVRRTVFYRGRVQGVGFRRTAAHLARRYPVTGYVRNCRDGRVELVAEGSPSALDSLLDAVANWHRANITATDVSEVAATGEWTAFDVREDA